MAIQKTYLESVLECSIANNRWLSAAAELETKMDTALHMTYTWNEDTTTVECACTTGESFSIAFNWIRYGNVAALSITISTYVSVLDVIVKAYSYIIPGATAISVSMIIGRMVGTVESLVKTNYAEDNDVTYTPTAIECGTQSLTGILRAIVGRVYFDNFNYDWPNMRNTL